MLAVMAAGFVLLGAGNMDLGAADSRVGLAARESVGPLGQVFGFWAPDLWPGRVLASQLFGWLEEGGRPAPELVLWPQALAAVAIGWLLARRMSGVLGSRGGLWMGLCWFGCAGVIDHSGGTGLEFLSGLAVMAALDRLLTRGSGWSAGLWASAAFLTGGWPPVALILLAVIVIGRSEARFSLRLLLPPLTTVVLWSAWTLSVASPEALAAALALPLTQRPDWWLAPTMLALGLPFAPLGLLALLRSTRENWNDGLRRLVKDWAQVALACLIAGTVVPGLAQAARVPALAGLLVAAAAGLDCAWTRSLSRSATRVVLAVALAVAALWSIVAAYGGYLWLLVLPYYRPVGIAICLLSLAALVLGWLSLEARNTRRALVATGLVAAALKLAHWGYFVPELNYRYGQGPWGRAIGQWLMPNWTLHTFHDWRPDLAFAIGRPVRQLMTPRHLAYPATTEARHVLLLQSEFEHWPPEAPPLVKVAVFEDAFGTRRILARTEGDLVAPSGKVFTATQ